MYQITPPKEPLSIKDFADLEALLLYTLYSESADIEQYERDLVVTYRLYNILGEHERFINLLITNDL